MKNHYERSERAAEREEKRFERIESKLEAKEAPELLRGLSEAESVYEAVSDTTMTQPPAKQKTKRKKRVKPASYRKKK